MYVPEAQGGLPPGPHVQYVLGTRTRLGRWVRTAYCGTPGGIVVALVIKHADNIRRGFAAGLALILTSLGSHVLYGFTFTPEFVAGTLMVVLSIFLFNGNLSLHACGADALRGR